MTPIYYVYPGIYRDQKTKFECLVSETCDLFGITRQEFYCKWRKRQYCDARKVVSYISHYHLHIEKIEISRRTNRDHTTTLTQIKAAEDLIVTDPYFKSAIEKLTQKILV